MSDSRDPRWERVRVALAFGLAVLPPLVLLAYLAGRAAKNESAALLQRENEHAHDLAMRVRDGLAQAIREAEEACFPRDLSALRSREPRARAELEATLEDLRRTHPIASRHFALDEDGKILLPDARAPFRPEGAPPVDDADDDRATDAAALAKRRAARTRYADAIAAIGSDPTARAVPDSVLAALRAVADEPDASAALRARAAFLLGDIHVRRGEVGLALGPLEKAALSPVPVRDERGATIRTRAALERARILTRIDRAPEGVRAASAVAAALLAGEHRDLTAAEWEDALARARALVPEEARPALVRAEGDARERVAWVKLLDGELGPALRAALARERADELLHLSSLRDPPVLIAFRVLPALAVEPQDVQGLRTRRLLFGVALDLEKLAHEVLGPHCGEESLRHEPPVGLAVIDAKGHVRAYAGADAAPDASGHLRAVPGAIEATAPLELLPTWQVRVTCSGAAVAQASWQRTLTFLGLFVLALVATGVGGAATFRSVARSLELARMKQDFVSNVTHELKTPLTSIRMYAETLQLGRARTEEKRQEYLQHVLRECDRLQRLIEDILDFARLGEGKRPYLLAEGDVTEAVLEAIDLFRHSMTMRGFELYLDLPKLGALPPVDLDRDALVRAVLNLLSNAVKYSHDSKYVGVAVWREGDSIAIEVEDKGVGIEKDDLDRIFDRFFRVGDPLTRTVSGTGLGLALVDEVVRAHGGQIRVESAKGKGSTFTLLLPIVKDYRNVPWPPVDSSEPEEPAARQAGSTT